MLKLAYNALSLSNKKPNLGHNLSFLLRFQYCIPGSWYISSIPKLCKLRGTIPISAQEATAPNVFCGTQSAQGTYIL